MSDKQCPQCGLWNTKTAIQCDCGYEFSEAMEKPILESDPPVVVATISGRPIAELLKSTLEEQGIPCELSQSGLGAAYGGIIGPFAHVDVLVPSKFEREALKIVEDFNQASEIDP
jgi:hypothetical protein